MLFYDKRVMLEWTVTAYTPAYTRRKDAGPEIQMGCSSLARHGGLVYSEQEESQTWVDYSWVPEWE